MMSNKKMYSATVTFSADNQTRITELLNSLTISTGINVENFEMSTSQNKATFDECFEKIQEILSDDTHREWYSNDVKFKVQYRDSDTNADGVIVQCWEEKGFFRFKRMYGTRFEIEKTDDHEYRIKVFFEVGINEWAEDIDQRTFFNATFGTKDHQFDYTEISGMIFSKKDIANTFIRCLDVLDLIKD